MARRRRYLSEVSKVSLWGSTNPPCDSQDGYSDFVLEKKISFLTNVTQNVNVYLYLYLSMKDSTKTAQLVRKLYNTLHISTRCVLYSTVHDSQEHVLLHPSNQEVECVLQLLMFGSFSRYSFSHCY